MTLYINCCVREESRTDRLARAVLHKLGGDFTELNLYEENLHPLDRETLNKRTALIEQGDYSDPMFDYAKQFANADTSFPPMTKTECPSAYARRRSLPTSPQQAVPTTRPTAMVISRVLQRTFSAFRKRIW